MRGGSRSPNCWLEASHATSGIATIGRLASEYSACDR